MITFSPRPDSGERSGQRRTWMEPPARLTVYSESFQDEQTQRTGTLKVIRNEFGHVIVAFIGQEYPQALVAGSLQDCRKKWQWAKEWMATQLAAVPVKPDEHYFHVRANGHRFTGD